MKASKADPRDPDILASKADLGRPGKRALRLRLDTSTPVYVLKKAGSWI